MKTVIKKDATGISRAFLVTDDFLESSDPSMGIPLPTPDLSKINWSVVRKEITNALVDVGIFTKADLLNDTKLKRINAHIHRLILEKIIELLPNS